MLKDPERSGAHRLIISSVRHNADSDACLKEILGENPPYKTSVVIRAAILGLRRMDKTTREQLIIEAAPND